jgi:hypothetical protein
MRPLLRPGSSIRGSLALAIRPTSRSGAASRGLGVAERRLAGEPPLQFTYTCPVIDARGAALPEPSSAELVVCRDGQSVKC